MGNQQLGDFMRGIYKLTINNKYYIGKDCAIERNKRYFDHLKLLEEGSHYNKYLQRAFDKYRELEYEVLFKSDTVSKAELCNKEIFYIKHFNSFENGYNLTKGGEGMLGYQYTQKQLLRKSERVSCDKNPMARITLEDFCFIVDRILAGDSNEEISRKIKRFNGAYVSSIRRRKRLKKWFDIYYPNYMYEKDANPFHYIQNEIFPYETFCLIMEEICRGEMSFYSIDKKFGVPPGVTSRIKRGKFKKYLKRYSSSTTIESVSEKSESK